MTPEKRKKIKAFLADPAATENEKEICRKLLKDNPEPPETLGRPITGRELRDRMSANMRQGKVDPFWSFAQAAGQSQDAARRQQAAAQGAAAGRQSNQNFRDWLNQIIREDQERQRKK